MADLEDVFDGIASLIFTPLVPFSSYSTTAFEEPLEEVKPPLEQSIDVEVSGGGISDSLIDFNFSLPLVVVGAQNPPLFRISTTLRFKILKLLFDIPSQQGKITLSPEFATKDVFPSSQFLLPGDILHNVEGALTTCRQLRDEVMTYFWTQYKFHVTLSPFTAAVTSPLSQKWLRFYADRVQYLVIEVDMTKFGFGFDHHAAELGDMSDKIDYLFWRLIELLKRRPSTISSIHLMCRRYAGYRPAIDSSETTQPVLYCPIESLKVCNHIVSLSGILLNLRMSGFTQEYTDRVMTALFSDDDDPPPYSIPPDAAWPLQVPRALTNEPFNTPSSDASVQTPSMMIESPVLFADDESDPIAHEDVSDAENYIQEFNEQSDSDTDDDISIADLYPNFNFSTLFLNGFLGGNVEAENSTAGSVHESSPDSAPATETETEKITDIKLDKGKGKETEVSGQVLASSTKFVNSELGQVNLALAETNLDYTSDSDMTVGEMVRRMDHTDWDIDDLLILTGAWPSSLGRVENYSPIGTTSDSAMQEMERSHAGPSQLRLQGSIKRISTFITRVASVRGRKST